jgi:SAM-dependent methyltransferase
MEETVILQTEAPVALTSPDHLVPAGTMIDNSRNHRFNEKIYGLYPMSTRIRILDLGCSGGGFVKDCLDNGMFAVGLEGSDYSKRFRRAEWRTIPEYLFTCDVTKPFTVLRQVGGAPQPVRFNIITMWEVLEHIAEPDLPALVRNVLSHLEKGGLWILSVCAGSRNSDDRYHQTARPKAWWMAKFTELGFVSLDAYVRYFNTQFVRGPKYLAPKSFHAVLGRPGDPHPPIPAEPLPVRLYDRWLGCRIQQILAGTATR